MSAPKVYQIAEFPNSRYKFDIYDANCSEAWMDILANEKANGAIGIINLGYFGLDGGGWASGCKIHGEWMCKQTYTAYGICIDKDGNAFIGTGDEDNAYSYAEAVPAYMVNGTEMNTDQYWANNGTTTLGFKDGNLVCMLCDKDNGQNSSEQIAAMKEYGCTDILRMDGSWSSHGCLGFGHSVQPSQMRKDRSYLIIYDKQYTAPRTSKKVTIDPHGTGDAEKFANTFAICDEIKKALEETEGIECMISRYRDNADLDETLRAGQSDCWKANLIYSIDVDQTSDTGCTAYACSSSSTSKSNMFANYILSLMKEAGLQTTDTVKVSTTDVMLAKSYACAGLAMFVGDYSTEKLRWKAVEISVKAICNQLGVEYIPIPELDNEEILPEPDTSAVEYDPFNMYPDEYLRTQFQAFIKAGIFSEGVKMGEIVRYGDLTKALLVIIKAIADGDSAKDEDTDNVEPSQPDDTVAEPESPVIGLDENLVEALSKKVPESLKEIADILEKAFE